jgi:hypothetical protein
MKKNSTANVLICSILIAGFLSACSPRVEPIEIKTTPVEKPVLSVPSADRIVTRPVEWIIITENNYEKVFERLKKDNKDVVLFGITANGYENLALNIGDLRTHIEQKNAIIFAYRRYYVESQSSLNNAVKINN